MAGSVTVTLNLRMSDWGDAVGAPNLGTYQATIDGLVGYASGDGCDLGPLGGVGDPAGGFIDSTHPDFVFRCPDICPPCMALTAVSITQANYEMGASILGGCSQPDREGSDGVPSVNPEYGGTVKVDVPPCAAGSYTIPFVLPQTKTFMNDPFGVKIEPLEKTPVIITVPTGQCCHSIGAGGPFCADGITETECETFPPVRFFTAGLDCTSPCQECDHTAPDGGNSQCNDGDACTIDECTQFDTCNHTDNYDSAVYCCNPANGDLDVLDDGNECTSDYCDVGGYPAVHDTAAMDGMACTNVNPCVINDECLDGVCIGDLPPDLNIPCPGGDPDCPAGWFCNLDTLLCDCRLSTPICIDWVHEHRHYTDECCFDEGDLVQATVQIGAGTSVVTGGQFLIEYEADCLEFVGTWTIDPFLTVIDMDHEPGLIWIAVVAMDPADPEVVFAGTTGPADIVGMDFIMQGDLACCDPSYACLISENPRNTKLVDEEGDNVDIDICPCEPCPRLNGEITLNTPAPGFQVNADCGVPTAIIEWDAASASDTCDGPLEVDCQAEHDGGVPIDHLMMGGGEFPQGISYFICEATNSCGDTKSSVWTVSVSDQHAIDIEVHLSPAMNPGLFSRCICFDLYADCVSDPTTMCEVLDFGPPYNFPAHARALLKVDKGNYLCIAAYDPLHTLCAEAMVECVDNMWVATFKGDPLAGGNWLVGGNLNNDENIDVLDAGTYMYEIATMASYPNGNTDCDTEAPHGDINADGAVDAADYTFIVENFLMACKSPCCDDGTAGADAVLDATLKELRAMGLGHLSVADLNGDGRLNTDDMTAYLQGVQPQMLTPKRSSSR
jgi:hypothetical protein